MQTSVIVRIVQIGDVLVKSATKTKLVTHDDRASSQKVGFRTSVLLPMPQDTAAIVN